MTVIPTFPDDPGRRVLFQLIDAALAGRYTATETDEAIAAAIATKQPYRLELTKIGVRGGNIAAAATLNLEDASGRFCFVTGNDAISAVTLADGHVAIGRFAGTPTIAWDTLNGGGGSLAIPSGSFGIFLGVGSGVARGFIIRGDGKPTVMPSLSEVTGLAAALAAINSVGAVTSTTGWTRTSTTLAAMAANLDYAPQLAGSAGCNVLILVQGTIDGAAAAASARAYLQPWFSLGGVTDNALAPAVLLGLSRLTPTTAGHAISFQEVIGGRLTAAQRNGGTTYRVHVAGAVAEAGTTLTITRVQALFFEG